MQKYYAGIDTGSIVAKLILLDKGNNITLGEYCRHCARIQRTHADLHEARK